MNLLSKPDVVLPSGFTYELGETLNDQYFNFMASLRRQSTPEEIVVQRRRPKVRNILFQVYPFAGNNAWITNVNRVKGCLDQFNGQKIAAVHLDKNCASIDEVIETLSDFKLCFFLNDLRLREVVSFPTLLHQIGCDPEGVTFYCHTKGLTRHCDPTVMTWVEMMYATCLDKPNVVDDALERCACAGTFLKAGIGFDGSGSTWHYSGTFYWLRDLELNMSNKMGVDPTWYGAESYPSLVFDIKNAATLLMAGTVMDMDLYNEGYMQHRVIPEFIEWQSK